MSPTNALLHRYEVRGKNIRLLGSARVFYESNFPALFSNLFHMGNFDLSEMRADPSHSNIFLSSSR